jgi:hypothetical protein
MSSQRQSEVLFIFHLWVDPAAYPQIHYYATEGHVAEVVDYPGFNWGCEIDFGETDADGWKRIATVYGVESRTALDAFLASNDFRAYAEQRRDHERYIRHEARIATVTYRTQNCPI